MNEMEVEAGLPRTANYHYAKNVGNQLFVAGQVPNNSDGDLVGVDDPGAQAVQCLSNLQILLLIHEFNQQDIQQLTVYVVGEKLNLNRAWSAVEEWFDKKVPPATLLGVSVLGYENQLVEIDATVIKPTI